MYAIHSIPTAINLEPSIDVWKLDVDLTRNLQAQFIYWINTVPAAQIMQHRVRCLWKKNE